MKTRLSFIVLFAASLAAFAQPRLLFNNDPQHLIYFTTDPLGLKPGDAALGGTLVSGTPALGYPNLVADLYIGTTPDSLALIDRTTFSSSPGLLTQKFSTWIFSAGTLAYFQVQAHESIDSTAATAAAAGDYYGYSVIFSGTPGVNSKLTDFWPIGIYPPPGLGTSDKGAINVRVGVVPEPSALGLGLLGLGACLNICRKRTAFIRRQGTASR